MIIYGVSLKSIRQESSQKVKDIERNYNALVNKDSQYGREVKALLDLYRMVDQIWRTAPSEVKP
jgi:hypothetical protein